MVLLSFNTWMLWILLSLVYEGLYNVVPLPQILALIFWFNKDAELGLRVPRGFPVMFFLQEFIVERFWRDIRSVGLSDGWGERHEHRTFFQVL